MICYYKGRYLDEKFIRIPVESPGFQYGYGVFTSLRTNHGHAVLITEHLKRLEESCKIIGISYPNVDFKSIINELIRRNNNINLRIKITLFEENINQVALLIIVTELKIDNTPKSIKVISNNYQVTSFRGVKSLNYLENVHLHREAIKTGFDEGLLLNSKKLICECCYANIFLVRGEKIYTPKANDNILNGIIRQELIKNFSITEQDISFAELPTFDKAFFTNSVQGIVYIKKINDIEYRSQPIPKLEEWEKSIGLK